MADYGQEVVRARHVSNFNKKMRDDGATQTLPSIEIQGQVFQAMCDLTTLAAAIKVATVEVTSEVRATASAILAIILLFNGYFGRSGVWNIMKIEWVLAQIRSGKDWLKIKTILTSGIKFFSEMRLHEHSEYFSLLRKAAVVCRTFTRCFGEPLQCIFQQKGTESEPHQKICPQHRGSDRLPRGDCIQGPV